VFDFQAHLILSTKIFAIVENFLPFLLQGSESRRKFATDLPACRGLLVGKN